MRLARALLPFLSAECSQVATLAGRPNCRLSVEKKSINTLFEEATPIMTWSTPTFEDLRLGFEINLYINNR